MASNAKPLHGPDFLASFDHGKSDADYNPKQTVFRQGEPADSIFFLEAGLVKFTIHSKDGKAAVIGLFGPGEFFGEGCLAGKDARIATASTLTDAHIVRIDKKAATKALRADRIFSQRFLEYLLFRRIRTEEDLVDQLIHSTEKRLARILLLLTRYGSEERTASAVGKFSHETLAEMIGSTRSRVSFFMNKFRKLGLIDYNGGIKVRHSLQTFAQRD